MGLRWIVRWGCGDVGYGHCGVPVIGITALLHEEPDGFVLLPIKSPLYTLALSLNYCWLTRIKTYSYERVATGNTDIQRRGPAALEEALQSLDVSVQGILNAGSSIWDAP